MGWLTRGALKFRLIVLAVAAGVLGIGVMQLRGVPVDVLPEFTPPYAEVQTEALGLSADEVEQLITVPLEADLLNGVEGIEVIRSDSVAGLSSIVMVFTEGTNIYRARQLVEERLTQAHALPNVSKPPTLLQPLSSSNRVLMIGLASEKLTPIEQSVIARWTVKPRLLGVPGVANVSVWGFRDQQLQVQVDPEQLRDQGVTLNQVIRSAGNAQVVSPLTFLEASTPGTGGFVESPQQRLQVRHILEKIADPAELGKVPVDGTGGRLRLSDVSNIVVDHQPLIGDAVVAGGPGLVLVVEKFPGISTTEVTDGVESALEDLRPGLSGMRTDTSIFRPASYIDTAMDNLGLAVAVGALLVVLVLLALRFHWRSVLVAIVAVPLSLVVAGLLLELMGQGFNAIALIGLAAGVAVVVDEAIAPTDRVVRRLRERMASEKSSSVTSVVRDATAEIRRPLLYATMILLLAIVPVAVMGGRPGAFLAPLVLAYVVAVIAAMLVALTVTPVLTATLFARWQPSSDHSPAFGRVGAGYRAALRRFTGGLRGVLVAAGVFVLLGAAAIPFLGLSLLPTFQDRDVLVRLSGQPGTSNPRMTEIATAVARELKDVPGVNNVGAHVGRAVTGDRVIDVNQADVWVNIESGADYDATRDAIDAAVRDVNEVETDVVTYSTESLRDVGALMNGENEVTGRDLDVLTGVEHPLVVRLFGQDQEILRAEADRIQKLMTDVDGVVNPVVDAPLVQPIVEIEVDLDRAQRFGITPGAVRRAEATLLQGIQVGSIFQEQKVFDVVVQGAPSTRGSVENVKSLLIDRPDGGHVTLGEVADVRVVDSPAVIRRDAVSRRLDVVADVSGRSLGDVAADIESRLAEVALPLEYHAEVLDDSTSSEIGVGRVAGFALAAAMAAFLLLQAAFRSWRLAGLLIVTVPLSLVGGLVMALIDGAELSLGSLLGLLAVLGLATRTSVALVSDMQTREGRGEDEREWVVHNAAAERFVPVITTTAALAAFVLPVAVLGGRAGLELLHPMALVLLGGLVTMCLVTLFIVPALYLHFAPTATVESDEDLRIDLEPGREPASAWPRQRTAATGVPSEEAVK